MLDAAFPDGRRGGFDCATFHRSIGAFDAVSLRLCFRSFRKRLPRAVLTRCRRRRDVLFSRLDRGVLINETRQNPRPRAVVWSLTMGRFSGPSGAKYLFGFFQDRIRDGAIRLLVCLQKRWDGKIRIRFGMGKKIGPGEKRGGGTARACFVLANEVGRGSRGRGRERAARAFNLDRKGFRRMFHLLSISTAGAQMCKC
ncbi:hypothetical protein MPC1_190011 [Methylocella tundrae]|nr:hypothetical protein MPC1_190011 [Methylocella tundrae]